MVTGAHSPSCPPAAARLLTRPGQRLPQRAACRLVHRCPTAPAGRPLHQRAPPSSQTRPPCRVTQRWDAVSPAQDSPMSARDSKPRKLLWAQGARERLQPRLHWRPVQQWLLPEQLAGPAQPSERGAAAWACSLPSAQTHPCAPPAHPGAWWRLGPPERGDLNGLDSCPLGRLPLLISIRGGHRVALTPP